MTDDERYPYTYAADCIRKAGGANTAGIKLSRSDAVKILRTISNAIGMSHRLVASKIADYELSKPETVLKHEALEIAHAITSGITRGNKK